MNRIQPSKRRSSRFAANAARICAVLFGSAALYYCLIPALAQDTEKYIYLNGSAARPADMTNVNPAYVFVTPVKIDSASSITFRGYDSGRVYDTVSNYRVDSAGREWGYDYVDFVWTSDPVPITPASETDEWDCYFAPALTMQYQYEYVDDAGNVTELIHNAPWANSSLTGDEGAASVSGASYTLAFTNDNTIPSGTVRTVPDAIGSDNHPASMTFTFTGSGDTTVRRDSDNHYYALLNSGSNAVRFTVDEPCVLHVTAWSNGKNIRLINNSSNNTQTNYVLDSTTAKTVDIPISEAGTYSLTGAGGTVNYYSIEVSYPDSTSEGIVNSILPQTAEQNRTFTGFSYKMDGITGAVTDPNRIGDRSQAADAEGSFATSSGIAGTLSDSSIRVYHAKATFFDYYSDWELSGQKLVDHGSYYGGLKDAQGLYKQYIVKVPGEEGPGIYNASVVPGSAGAATFAESTGTISYSYQGDLWNQIIFSAYNNTGSTVYPLYFGSNSWFTGNTGDGNRYLYSASFTDELLAELDALGPDNRAENPNFEALKNSNGFMRLIPGTSNYAYYMPFDRQYLTHLTSDTVLIQNSALGMGNSRGVPGLLNTGASDSENVALLNTDFDAPYFNRDFLLGENETNSVYGKVYDDVAFDFIYNPETNYYEYDSTRTKYATRLTLDTDSDSYYMQYTGAGVKKADTTESNEQGSSQTIYQFYPFNSPATNNLFSTENLMFGMKLEIPYTMFRDADKRTDSIFKFSGDDDVWVFLDDNLALDIGGTHTAVGGFIDLKTGYGVLASAYDENTGTVVGGSVDSGLSGTAKGMQNTEKAAFAILATNGVNPENANQDLTVDYAEFFDDKYRPHSDTTIHYSYSIDGDYITVNYNTRLIVLDAHGNESGFLDPGSARFKLTKDLNNGTPNTDYSDLESHNLTIYYMERGLNSSNFKLAFNFVANTQREVSKVWEDGETTHNPVQVELYRADPVQHEENDSIQNVITTDHSGRFTWPSGTRQLIKAVSENNTSTSESSVIVAPNNPVSVVFQNQNGHSLRSVRLTINGRPLTRELFTALKNVANLDFHIYMRSANGNDLEITENNFVTLNGADHIRYNTSNSSLSQAVVTVSFNALQSLSVDGQTWTLDGWLIEASSYQNTDGSHGNRDNFRAPTITSSGAVTSFDFDGRTLQSSQLRFLIVREMYQRNALTVKVLPKVNWTSYSEGSTSYTNNSENLEVRWASSNFANREYHMSARSGPLSTAEGTEMYSQLLDGAGTPFTISSDASDSANYNAEFSARISPLLDSDEDVEIFIHRDATPSTYNPGTLTVNQYYDFTKTETQSLNTYTYTYDNPMFVTRAEISGDSWNQLWDNLVKLQKFTENDLYHEEPYIYYIREIPVSGSGVITEYETTYRGADGNLISPEPMTVYTDASRETTEEYALFRVDDESLYSVYNKPLTRVQVTKNWADNIAETDRAPVLVDVYQGDGTLVDTLTLSSPGWTAECSGLELYEYNESEQKYERIIYYVHERDPGDAFIVSYTPLTNDVIQVGQETAFAVGDDNTVSLTNSLSHTGEFALQLNKQAYGTEEPLANASFLLEVSDDGGVTFTEVGVLTTNESGLIQQSGLTAKGKTYRLTETSAPPGYVRNEVPIVFHVNADSLLYLSFQSADDLQTESGSLYQSAVFDTQTQILTVTMVNHLRPVIMPATGGGGIVYLIIAGTVMLILSLAFMVYAEKHRQTDHSA